MANDGTGTGWDETYPQTNGAVSEGPQEIQDLRKGVRIRQNKEHVAAGVSSAGGEHKPGSALIYVVATEADLAALVRPDGVTSLTVGVDVGRMAVTLDTGLLYYLKNVAGTPTWTKFVANASFSQVEESYVKLEDVKSGAHGGTFTAGTWQTRDLNTKVYDADAVCTPDFGNNRFALAAGTYRFRIRCPANRVGMHQARLKNVTDTTYLYGTSESTDTTVSVVTWSEITGRFTITGSKTYEIQHICETTKASNGMGIGTSSIGSGEHFTTAEFWKEV